MKALSFNDLVTGSGGTFRPHAHVEIPELANRDNGDIPVIYLVSPSAGKVLELGVTSKAKMAKKGGKDAGPVPADDVAENTETMIGFIIDCARNEDGSPLCTSAAQVRSLPAFVFTRLAKGINLLMAPDSTEKGAGKD